MDSIELDVRYYHQPRRGRVTENEFAHQTLRWDLKVDQTALILVDVWSDLYVTSHLERAGEITRKRIVPLLEAFRRLGATVVHAPSPDCARKYPQWTHYAGPEETGARPSAPADTWPPPEFRAKSGDYRRLARPEEPRDELFYDIIANREIQRDVRPQGDDFVAVTGAQLHRLLSHREVLHLFYAGFAANMCVPFRDYGTRAMKDRGYDIILLRDCTAAIEVADTHGDLALTRAAVADTELNIGYTAASADLLAACERVVAG